MAFSKTQIPYRETGAFSKLALDYIDQLPSLKPFFSYPASVKGIEEAIAKRQKFSTGRALLQQALKAQYSGKETSVAVSSNLEKLANKNCFTVTTAHQNNLLPAFCKYESICWRICLHCYFHHSSQLCPVATYQGNILLCFIFQLSSLSC